MPQQTIGERNVPIGMRQTTCVPMGEASTLCLCDESHYWSIGDIIWECDKCGRLYFKGDRASFTDDYIRYRLDHDNLTIIIADYET